MQGNRFFVILNQIHVLVQVGLMDVELAKLNWLVLVAEELLTLLSPILQMMLLNRSNSILSLTVLYIDSRPVPPLIDVGPDRLMINMMSSSSLLLYAGSST